MQPTLRRLIPEKTFPVYSHTPGQTPHSNSHPEGHSYQSEHDLPAPLTAENWQSSTPYLYGLDLFNYGYYWESHEVWEGLWIANKRTGVIATFLKGLIKLAAASLKIREDKPNGVQNHCQRAAECFEKSFSSFSKSDQHFLGFSLDTLIIASRKIAQSNIDKTEDDLQKRSKDVPVEPVKPIHNVLLTPQRYPT